MIYKCEDCGLTFHRITAFTRHRRNRHPKLKKQVNLEPGKLGWNLGFDKEYLFSSSFPSF